MPTVDTEINITKNKVINCDCMVGIEQLFRGGYTIDGVITSPPYNIVRPNSTDRGYDLYKDGMSNEEYAEWLVNIVNSIDRILNPNGKIIINLSYGCENTECMNLTVAEILKRTNYTLADIICWKKDSATPNNVSPNRLTRICEFVYVFCRRGEEMSFTSNKRVVAYRESGQAIYENVFNFMTARNNDESCPLNKANYSTDFVNKILNIYFPRKSILLDPFGGTGTTVVACRQLDCDCYSFEISSKQCEWANKRIQDNTSQMTIFDFL